MRQIQLQVIKLKNLLKKNIVTNLTRVSILPSHFVLHIFRRCRLYYLLHAWRWSSSWQEVRYKFPRHLQIFFFLNQYLTLNGYNTAHDVLRHVLICKIHLLLFTWPPLYAIYGNSPYPLTQNKIHVLSKHCVRPRVPRSLSLFFLCFFQASPFLF